MSVFTCEGESHLPLPVLLPHRRRQVTGVRAAVWAGDVGQEDVSGSPLQVQLPLHARVPLGRPVGELSAQKARETGVRSVWDLKRWEVLEFKYLVTVLKCIFLVSVLYSTTYFPDDFDFLHLNTNTCTFYFLHVEH